MTLRTVPIILALAMAFMPIDSEYYLVAFSYGANARTQQGEGQDSSPTPDDIADAVRSLSSKVPVERNRAILRLFTYANRGYLPDLDNKASLFAHACTSTDVSFAYKLSCLLARLPKDRQIVSEAEKMLDGKAPSQVIAAIAYLERYSPVSVERYFRGKEYSGLPSPIRGLFHDNPHLVRLRDAYIAETLEKYLNWPQPKEADQPNPFRDALLKDASDVSSYIAANKDQFTRPEIPLRLLWLLGEIGNPVCFDMLMQEYRTRPDYRRAVSLAACTGSLQIEQLVKSLTSENLHVFLRHILSQETYDTIKDFNKQQIVEYWRTHFGEIRNRCIQLSQPQLG